MIILKGVRPLVELEKRVALELTACFRMLYYPLPARQLYSSRCELRIGRVSESRRENGSCAAACSTALCCRPLPARSTRQLDNRTKTLGFRLQYSVRVHNCCCKYFFLAVTEKKRVLCIGLVHAPRNCRHVAKYISCSYCLSRTFLLLWTKGDWVT